MKKFWLLLLASCFLGHVTICFAKNMQAPVTIAIAIAANSQEVKEEQVKAAWENWAAHFQKKLNRTVNIVITKDYMSAADLLVKGKVNLAYLKQIPLQKAMHESKGIISIASVVGLNGETTYQAIIAKNCNTQISNINELRGKTLGVIKYSLSGDEIANQWLRKNGLSGKVKLETFNSHQHELEALKNNKIFAAFTWDGAISGNICSYQTTASGLKKPELAVNTHYSSEKEINEWKSALSATKIPKAFWPVLKVTSFKPL